MKSEMEESKSDDGKDQPAVVHHYFVDEAGDPSLFNAKGKVIVGTEGCSRYFRALVGTNSSAVKVEKQSRGLLR